MHNAYDLPLLLGVQVLLPKSWKLTAYLMVYGQHLRRLDVNGSHSNWTGNREVWNERTHKHTFSEQHLDTLAYTPGDIPTVPQRTSRGSIEPWSVRGVFCRDQTIKLTGEYRWIDPVLPTR